MEMTVCGRRRGVGGRGDAWTPEALADRLRQNPSLKVLGDLVGAAPSLAAPGRRAKRLDGYDSALEARYAAEVLTPLHHTKGIAGWWHPAPKLFLAEKTFYTPDFLVWRSGWLECHEVKGYWREDARVKIKVAAEHYPCLRFLAVEHAGGRWRTEMFLPRNQQDHSHEDEEAPSFLSYWIGGGTQ